MAEGEFLLCVGGRPPAPVGVGVAHVGMRGDGASMPPGLFLALNGAYELHILITSNTMHNIIAVRVVIHIPAVYGAR